VSGAGIDEIKGSSFRGNLTSLGKTLCGKKWKRGEKVEESFEFHAAGAVCPRIGSQMLAEPRP
jgi:hypothetical protein